jgi:hypothetical protein
VHLRSQRVNVAFQFTSHVFPPSGENACSTVNDVTVTFREHESNEDAATVERILTKELTASVFEPSVHRRPIQHAFLTVCPRDVPLLRLRVVETERQSFDVTGRSIDLELSEVGTPVPDLAHDRRAVVVDPCRGARRRTLQPRHVSLPRPELEIEVVLAVARRLPQTSRLDWLK